MLGGATPTIATALPNGFTDTLVAGIDVPTALAFTPDGRLLVTTQFGEVRLVLNDVLVAQPVLDLAAVLCTPDEMGLLGAAVDPAFASNGFVYLYYTRNKPGRCVNRVSRFTMSGNTIAPASELVLVDEIPATGNHNAGDLHFGNDGYLYVSVGDGGCDYAGDSGCAGENDASRDQHALIGKILRLTSNGGIPPSNPFQGAGTARCNVTGQTTAGNKCQETFAWGLRNPFRVAFDPNTTATRFFINDVGQGAWEEVDLGTAGADYGWNVREGPCANGSLTNCGPPPAGMTNPIYSYSHPESGCAAITGGAFVPDGIWPASYDDTYLYGDYTCGKIFVLTPNGTGGFTRSEFTDDVGAIVNMTFGPSPLGQALYYTNYTNGGQVRRIESTVGNRPPTARLTATPTSGPLPLVVSFDGSTSTDPDAGDTLTYVWNFGDGSSTETTQTPTTSHTYTVNGTFDATLTVRDNHGASSAPATVRVDPGNTAPQVTIDSPTTAERFAVGQTITLHGTATDGEDGPLPASSLSWRVLRHHDTHTHPFLAPTPGNDVPITQPPPEDLGSGIDGYLEVQLTATDSAGVSTTVTQNVLPNKVDVTFATAPVGRNVVLGGTTYAGPKTLTSWQGYAFSVDAPAQTDGSGTVWNFQSWSDGGAAAHSITTPATPTTYTATFAQSSGPAGLVAAYGFDAGSGSVVADGSGSGNVGLVSGAVWSVAGRFGSALSFDGVNDWVSVPDASSLDLVSGMTLEAWVRPSSLGGWRTAVVKERTDGTVYGLYADQAAGRPLGQVYVAAERNAVGSSSLPVNAWSHVAATYDGGVVRLYVNGVLAGSTSFAGVMAASTGVLRIGGNSVWGEWFAGLIDEVRVYNRPLSAAEIQQDSLTPVGESPPPPDTTAPSAPSGVSALASVGSVALGWAASSDNVAVVRYNVHRSQTAGFTPTAGNRIAQPAGTGYTDSGLAAGTYYYRVTAEDAAGNISGVSAEVSAVVPAPVTGLVAAYGFDAGSGPTVADASGTGNAGSVSGAAWTVAGRYGAALSFDGVDDWVSVPDASSLDLTSGMTVEAWVRPSALGGWRTVVFKERPGGVVYGLYADQAGSRPLGQVFIAAERNAVGAAALPLNAWSHLATTYDGAVVRLYVNGVLAGSTSFAGAMVASTGVLRIGGNSVWDEWFAGLIDEVRVYNRPLSAAEIQQDSLTPVGGSPPPDTLAPSAPSGVSALASVGSVALGWAASSDNVAVVRYNVHRSQTAGFTPTAGNRIAQPVGTGYTDSGLAGGTYYYRVTAEDAAGNVSSASAEVSAVVPAPATGLVAAYGFDAGSGSVVADGSGSGNVGLVSGAVWSVAGRFGSALSFDGVNDWVSVPDASSLDLVSGMTLEAWVRPSSLGGWRTAVVKERTDGTVYGLYADQAAGRPLGQVYVAAERNAVGTSSLPVNAWSHLAATYDGGVVRLYVNGVLAGSTSFAGVMVASTGVLRIGGNSVWGEWFAGLIDEVRVYNRPLSAAEIQQDMQTPLA